MPDPAATWFDDEFEFEIEAARVAFFANWAFANPKNMVSLHSTRFMVWMESDTNKE